MPNQHTLNAIISSLNDSHSNDVFTSELYSHTNIVILDKYDFIFYSSDIAFNVALFSPDLGIAQNIPIFDDAIAYD